jgi:hypothetical protein
MKNVDTLRHISYEGRPKIHPPAMQKKSISSSTPARRSLSTRRRFARRLVGEAGFFRPKALILVVLSTTAGCAITGTLLATAVKLTLLHPQAPANTSQTMLTFEERVSYQRAIEDVYWRHRVWPNERPDPKPSLDAVMSQGQLGKKVQRYLRKSQAPEDYWQRPITAEQLQAEMEGTTNSASSSNTALKEEHKAISDR